MITLDSQAGFGRRSFHSETSVERCPAGSALCCLHLEQVSGPMWGPFPANNTGRSSHSRLQVRSRGSCGFIHHLVDILIHFVLGIWPSDSSPFSKPHLNNFYLHSTSNFAEQAREAVSWISLTSL